MSYIQNKEIVKQFIRIISYALKHRNDHYTNKAIRFFRRMNISYGTIIVCNYMKEDFPRFGIAASIGLLGYGIIFIEKSFFENRKIPEKLKEFIIAHEVAHIARNHVIFNLLSKVIFVKIFEVTLKNIIKVKKPSEALINLLLGLIMLIVGIMIDMEVVKIQELEADNIAIQLAGCEGALYFAKALEAFKKQGINVSHKAILGVPALSIEERINNLRQHCGFFLIV